MSSTRKSIGIFLTALLSLSMFASAAADSGVPMSADLGWEACAVEAAAGSEVNFEMNLDGSYYVATSDSVVNVDVTGKNALGGDLCLIDAALDGGQLNGPSPFYILQNRITATVPVQGGGDLGQSWLLLSGTTVPITLEMDDLESWIYAPGVYTGTLNITVNTGA